MLPPISLTREDVARLTTLLEDSDRGPAPLLARLESELQRATVTPPDAARPFVRLGARVTWLSLETGRTRTAKLVLPREVRSPETELSVLTPVGCALIGLRVGDTFAWSEGARQWRVRVLAVDQSAT